MRALPLLTILLMALLALPTSAARFVIVGVAGIDDRATRLQAIDLDSRAADGSVVATDVEMAQWLQERSKSLPVGAARADEKELCSLFAALRAKAPP